MKQFALLTIFCILLNVSTQNPGIKLAVTPDFFATFQKSLLPQLIAKIGTIEVASIQAGGLTLSDVVISEINLPAEDVRFGFNDSQLSVSHDNFGLRVDMAAYYDLYLFSVGFNMVVACRNSSFSTAFGFGYNNDHVVLNMNASNFQIKNLDLYFPAWLADAIIGSIVRLFIGSIEDMLSDNLSDALKGVVADSINQIMASMPGFEKIPGTFVGVDYNPSQSPKIASNFLSLGLNGTFYDSDKGFAVPPVPFPSALPDYDQTIGGSTQVFISDYMINTALYTFWQSGALKVRVTNSMIPPAAPVKLDIQWLQVFIPEVSKHYGSTVEIAFDIAVNNYPIAKITPHDVEASLESIVTFYAVQGSNFTEIASLQGYVHTHANATVSNWTVAPFVSNATFDNYKVIHSDVGSIDPGLFEQGMNLMMGLVIPVINAQGIVVNLPNIPYVDLKTLSVHCNDGYLEITANPTFDAPAPGKIDYNNTHKYQYESQTAEFLQLN